MRVALDDAAPLWRGAPEALPKALPANRKLAGELIIGTPSALGKQFRERPPTAKEIETYAAVMANMFYACPDRLWKD